MNKKSRRALRRRFVRARYPVMSAASVLRNIREKTTTCCASASTKIRATGSSIPAPLKPLPTPAGDNIQKPPRLHRAGLSPKGLTVRSGDSYEQLPLDAVFPVLHGKNGEDGTMQGLLQLAGLPFVGCDATSSAACMDKVLTNVMLDAMDIPQAKYVWFYDYEYQKDPRRGPPPRGRGARALPGPLSNRPTPAPRSASARRPTPPL